MRDWSGRCRKAVFASVLAALLALGASSTAAADDTSLGVAGGTIVARPAAGIRLAAETVQVVCFGSFAEYRVDFCFLNEGRARNVRLGFPFSSALTGWHGGERPFGFQAWRGRRPLAVKIVGVGHGNTMMDTPRGYFVHTARFAHGASTITVSYLAQVSARAGTRDSDRAGGGGGIEWYEYWLHTGRTWKGPIGSAVVRYSAADTFRGRGVGLTKADADEYVPVTTPGWTQPLPGVYQWRRTRFEPKPARGDDWWTSSISDLTLGFGVDWSGGARRPKWTSSARASASLLAAGGGPGSAGDGALSSCWIAGPLSSQDHPWLEASFKRPRHLRELRIVAGDNAYVAAFSRYGRPRTMTASFSDGSSAVLRLADAPVLQRFPVDVTTTSVKLTVDDVYAGTDYPAVCISEVEFGGRPAPLYASCPRLLADDRATGRLPAWAGRVSGGIRAAGRVDEWQARQDAESVSGGDLIGVDEIESYPLDAAPFRVPAELADLEARPEVLGLPPADLVGDVVTVDALSHHTFDISYASGVELAVNTRASRDRPAGVLAELLEEARDVADYTDGRRLPYEVTTIGAHIVGVARRGTIACSCEDCGTVHVPAQVFWRDGPATYHLYARDDGVTTADLSAVAASMLTGPPVEPSRAAPVDAGRPWWWAAVLSAALVAFALFLIRRAARPVAARR